MPKLHPLAALLAALALLATAATASAAPVTVNLRVEGSAKTLFEGPVTTDAKTLTKDGTGQLTLSGLNTYSGSTSINAGIVWINSWFLRDLRTPFGGSKQSGIGREGGVHSIEFYTELRNVCVST